MTTGGMSLWGINFLRGGFWSTDVGGRECFFLRACCHCAAGQIGIWEKLWRISSSLVSLILDMAST